MEFRFKLVIMANKNEGDLMRSIMLRLSRIPGTKVFRNNVATAWVGASKMFNKPETVNVKPGDVLIHNARILHAGLCVGSSDIIGFKSVVVTPEMVGKTIAIFAGVEIKTASGKLSKEQIAFIDTLNRFGAIGAVARNEDEAEHLFKTKL